jgi:uncharacterized protein
MRVSIDTNVFVSYLLNRAPDRNPSRIIQAAFDRHFELILSETLLKELATTVLGKPYLVSRIGEQKITAILYQIRLSATIVPEIPDALPAITRDPGDDYLIVHAVRERVDYLVSDDKDLLAFGDVEGLRIVSPADFVRLLRGGVEVQTAG